MTRDIQGLAEIRDCFDAVLIDQFGVLHDGHDQFPGTLECLKHISDAQIPMVALSNSGKRSHLNVARLERLGFPKALFKAVITSGELAYMRIAEHLSNGRLESGTSVAVISRDNDASMIEGLPVRRVELHDSPQLMIIAATEPDTRTLDSYLKDLEPLAKAGVPALCINPDRQIYAKDGPAFGPGVLADRYRSLGGMVEMLGKPGIEMFRAGLEALGDPAPERCLMIGDSPEHDIAGAKAAECQTLLISSGVQSGTGLVKADFRIRDLRW